MKEFRGGEGGRGRGGYGKPPITRASEESGANDGNEGMACGPRTAPPPHPQRDTAADNNSVGPQPQQSDGTDGASPKNGMHSYHEYGLLALEDLE